MLFRPTLHVVVGAALTTVVLLGGTAYGEELWTFDKPEQAPSVIRIDFVRGDIEIVRRSGPLRIEVLKVSRTNNEAGVAIIANQTESRLELTDRYPSPALFTAPECLPPAGERGDFWNSDVYLMTKIFAPAEIAIEARFMARPNRAERTDTD